MTPKANRIPRLTSGPAQDTWREKLQPLFIKSAELNRKVVTLSRSNRAKDRKEAARLYSEGMPELLQEAESLYDLRKLAGETRCSRLIKALGIDQFEAGTEIAEADYLTRWLCSFRFGKTFETLKQEYESGDLKAVKQMHKLAYEVDLWRIGELNPNKLKFKIDVDHFVLMDMGLDMGLEDLTADELADCFNKLCPCGREHSPEDLRKLRARILEQSPPTSP